MDEIDTEVQRKHVEQLHKFNHVDNLALAGRAYLDHIDRLQSENHRLGEERNALASSLAIETYKYRDAWDENQRLREAVEAADRLMRTAATDARQSVNAANAADVYSDGNITLAAWYPKYDSDRTTFNECLRLEDQRLRASTESTGGGDG